MRRRSLEINFEEPVRAQEICVDSLKTSATSPRAGSVRTRRERLASLAPAVRLGKSNENLGEGTSNGLFKVHDNGLDLGGG